MTVAKFNTLLYQKLLVLRREYVTLLHVGVNNGDRGYGPKLLIGCVKSFLV